MLVYQNAIIMSIVFYSFSDNFAEKFFLHYIYKNQKILVTAGRQDGRQAATVPIGYRLNCLRLTIFVPKFSTINTSFNIYMILNSYKSYIIASLFVRSTAVPAVTAGQPIGAVGSTGNSTGNHLHLELLVNGEPINPADCGFPVTREEGSGE